MTRRIELDLSIRATTKANAKTKVLFAVVDYLDVSMPMYKDILSIKQLYPLLRFKTAFATLV